jgi:hypothetical protein
MSETLAAFQPPMFWLKADAESNMSYMLLTEAVIHLEMSALNVALLANSEAMRVTAAVFQSPMLPYVVAAVVGLVIHAVTAVAMLASVMQVTQSELTVQVATLNVGHAALNVAPHAV